MKPVKTILCALIAGILQTGQNQNPSKAVAPVRLVLAALLIALFPLLSHAGTWVPFGPQTYVRGSGDPMVVTSSFSVLNPNTVYVLRINNGGLNGQFPRTTGVITLNGNRILGPLELNPHIPVVERPIRLRSNDQLGVELRGTTGSGILLQVIGIDFGPPSILGTISPPPNAAGWNNSNVTVSFTCSDKTSGVASCPAPVVLSNDGASQFVSGTVTDNAGNKATVSVRVNLDKMPPVISGTINPAPDAGGWNSPPATVSFGCSDQLSGIASCSPAVTLTTEGANQIVPGTATDLAGNIATAPTKVNISTSFFLIRNYAGKCLDYGGNTRSGGAVVFLNDCAQAHPIRVEEINSNHEVVLHAGTQVLGVHYDTGGTVGGPSLPPPTELALELQAPADLTTTPRSNADQIFGLDGDSIILASSRPCINKDYTTPCPPPPPELVVEIENARGANGSPLVAGIRNLADSEFWDFIAIDGSSKDPTDGFVHVATNDQLWNTVCAAPRATSDGLPPPNNDPTRQGNSAPCDTLKAGWGTVIVVSSPNRCDHVPGAQPGDVQDVGICIDMSAYAPLVLPSGVTIRGGRHGNNFGPQIYAAYYNPKNNYSTGNIPNCPYCLFQIHGDYVRITGLRMHGQTRSKDKIDQITSGILVDFPIGSVDPDTHQIEPYDYVSTTEYISIVDHNDMSDWVAAAVNVDGGHHETLTCDGIVDDPATLANVRIERNFLHHNVRKDLGYGAGMGDGGRALVSGNTFLMNRHAIAADGELHDSYRASFNLVLSEAPVYDGGLHAYHDFDMHGTLSSCCDLFDQGVGGNYVDIVGNTFLGTDRNNFKLRGVPCNVNDFRNNVALQDQASLTEPGDTVAYTEPVPGFPINIASNPNQFNYPNPTTQFRVGDFDADKADDLFLATGATWYYSPAGAREWRFLNAKTDPIDQLLFGDFDGDGRTDVVAIHGGQFVVSWGGVSDWEVLNADPTPGRLLLLPSAVSAMAVGDFDGDGIADIFYADGQSWWLSYGGNTPFVLVNTSSFLVKDLRFGDFDGDGKTDVFGVVSNGTFNTWSYSKGATGSWSDGYLRPALANTVDGLVVADFNGDGFADVAANCDGPACWRISYNGFQDWKYISAQNSGLVGPEFVAVGHFLGHAAADVLTWNLYDSVQNTAICDPNVGQGTHFCISVAGIYPGAIYSTQEMR